MIPLLNQTKPNQTKANQTKTNKTNPKQTTKQQQKRNLKTNAKKHVSINDKEVGKEYNDLG